MAFGFFGEGASVIDWLETTGPGESPYLEEVDFFCAFVAFRVSDSY